MKNNFIIQCPRCGKQILKEPAKNIYLINNTCDECDIIMEEVVGEKIVSVTIDGIKSVEGDDLWENFFKIATRIEIGYLPPNIKIKFVNFHSLSDRKEYLEKLYKVMKKGFKKW